MATDPVLITAVSHGLFLENPPPVFILFSCLIGCLVPLTLLTINNEIKHYIKNEVITKFILGPSYILWAAAVVVLIIKMNDTSFQVVPNKITPSSEQLLFAVELEGYLQIAITAFILAMCAMCALSVFGITPNFKKNWKD